MPEEDIELLNLKKERERLEIKKLQDDAILQAVRKEKEDMELRKLQDEEKLRQKPLKNPVNWTPFLSVISTLAVIIWAISTNYYTNQNTYYQNKAEYYRKVKDSLMNTVAELQLLNSNLHSQIKAITDSNKFADETKKTLQKIDELNDKLQHWTISLQPIPDNQLKG